jgi:hypothetical protein
MLITQNSELNSSSTSLTAPARLLHQSKIHVILMSPFPSIQPPRPSRIIPSVIIAGRAPPPLDESKDMEVGLKQFVYCPFFSPTCLCSFVVLYGGGVAAGQELHRARCGDGSVAAAAAAALMRMRSAISHDCNTAHPAPPRSVTLRGRFFCF